MPDLEPTAEDPIDSINRQIKQQIEAAEPHDFTERPDSVVIQLDEMLSPDGFVRPCPERGVAYLGFREPVVVPCGLVQFHDGPHMYHIEWSDHG